MIWEIEHSVKILIFHLFYLEKKIFKKDTLCSSMDITATFLDFIGVKIILLSRKKFI